MDNKDYTVNEVWDAPWQFRHNAKIGPEYHDREESILSQYDVFHEEKREFMEAMWKWQRAIDGVNDDTYDVMANPKVRADVAEEMADVMVTVSLLADMMGISWLDAYMAKMEYNMHKSFEKDENGKVTDDSDVEKPDFTQFVGE